MKIYFFLGILILSTSLYNVVSSMEMKQVEVEQKKSEFKSSSEQFMNKINQIVNFENNMQHKFTITRELTAPAYTKALKKILNDLESLRSEIRETKDLSHQIKLHFLEAIKSHINKIDNMIEFMKRQP